MSSECNWANKTIWTGDNLPIMRRMNGACVDLIYLDPPFNSNVNYAAPIGSKAAGGAFKDTWNLSDIDVEWINLIESRYPGVHRVLLAAMTPSDKAYLAYMAIRLIEMRRILKKTGSIYLHCDPTMSHYLKLLMDAVFDRGNFRNEVVWCYSTSGRPKKFFAKKHDVILFYTASDDGFWGDYKVPLSVEYLASHYRHFDSEGRRCRIRIDHGTERIYYPEEGAICNDWWEMPYLNSMAKERLGYPTQKPLVLLERIISASSKKGDIVFDPFCGCATTLVAAEDLSRNWVGIDISERAAELVVHRIRERQGMFRDIVHRTDLPLRTDLGKVLKPVDNRKGLYGEQEGFCAGCGEHFESRHLEVDHIISRSKGGTDHYENLQLLCGSCNRIKGDRGMEYLKIRLGFSEKRERKRG